MSPDLPYPFNSEDYSLTETMIFDDHFEPFYQLPVDLRKSTKSSVCRTPHSRSRQGGNSLRTNSIYHSNLQLDDLDKRSPVTIERDLDTTLSSDEVAKKRREQNRASQRAYRARRDKHLEELEQRNQFLQRHASALLEENERLKLQLSQLLSSQNSLTKDSPVSSGVSPVSTTFITPSPSTATQHDKDYLDVKETWDLIQDHWLYKCGHIRIEDIYQRLKGGADNQSLDGTQKREDVLNAIQSCSVGRHYDLL